MKKLLLLSFLVLGFSSSYAQLTCATATTITGDGTLVCPAITGTYVGTCAPNGAVASPNAIWWKYTATASGEVTVSSDVFQATGNSDDTRVSVFAGTCAALVCYAGADDIAETNYLTELTFPVLAGDTYYIAWDDRWSALGFSWSFTFQTVSCIRPNAFSVTTPTNVTVNSATLGWGASIGTPASYDVQYGPVGFVLGAGTTVNTTSTSVTLSGITPASSNVEYYIRSNCGANQSEYIGPFALYLAKTLPYANTFDNVADYADGATATGWALNSNATLSQTPLIFWFSTASTTAATNASIFSRGIALQANEQVTTAFFTRLNAAAGSPQTLKVWANTTPSLTGATQMGADISVSGNTYAAQSRTFTAPTAGTYYFIFNNASPIVATATNMFFDSLALTSVLGTNDYLSSTFSVYPNPANNVINFTNDTNAVISSVEMTDINGRTVKSVKVDATSGEIAIGDLATGMYMMTITSDQGVVTKKIVKQ